MKISSLLFEAYVKQETSMKQTAGRDCYLLRADLAWLKMEVECFSEMLVNFGRT
jgi:hypothetical protein